MPVGPWVGGLIQWGPLVKITALGLAMMVLVVWMADQVRLLWLHRLNVRIACDLREDVPRVDAVERSINQLSEEVRKMKDELATMDGS